MTLFDAALMLAAFLCSVVSGFLFAFAAVVMPGLRRLDDGEFLRAFRAIDRVIQNSQPLFVVVWLGSVLALVVASVIGVLELTGLDRLLMIVATLAYIGGVQVPTAAINVPLNNTVQRLELSTMSEPMRKRARSEFEPRWNRWNAIRTACASLTSILLMLLLLRA